MDYLVALLLLGSSILGVFITVVSVLWLYDLLVNGLF